MIEKPPRYKIFKHSCLLSRLTLKIDSALVLLVGYYYLNVCVGVGSKKRFGSPCRDKSVLWRRLSSTVKDYNFIYYSKTLDNPMS